MHARRDFDSVTKYYSIRNQVETGEADIKSSNDREADKRAWQDCGAEINRHAGRNAIRLQSKRLE